MIAPATIAGIEITLERKMFSFNTPYTITARRGRQVLLTQGARDEAHARQMANTVWTEIRDGRLFR